MRSLLALFLLAALLPAPASGQVAGTTLLEDPAGDVRSEVAGTAGPPATTLYPGADLLSLSVAESQHSFTFRLGMAAVPSASDPGLDGVNYLIHFSHNGRQFEIMVWKVLEGLQAVTPQPPFAWLAYRDSGDAAWSFIWISETAPFFDAAAKSLTIDVLRLDLADAEGATPFPGRSLEGIRAEAHASLEDAQLISIGGSGGFQDVYPQRFVDEMPDDPASSANLPVAIGPRQTGHARLTSDHPFRSSNGEATTMLFAVDAHNLGDAGDRFELTAEPVPRGYSLTLPVPLVDIPAQSSLEVPVLLTMPFGHQHGAAASFVLEMTSLSDGGSVGRIELGVRFLDIPQPAGHHDTVFLHKSPTVGGVGPAFGWRTGYMNTLEDDPSDTKEPLHTSYLSVTDVGRFESRWMFPLKPYLDMGIDIDPAKTGHLRLPIGTAGPMRETTVEAFLRVAPGVDWPQEGILLASLEPLPARDIAPNSEVLIEGALVPEPGVGPVPPERGNNLWLEVVVTSTGTMWSAAGEGAYIAPGGSARLPLREWHDAVDEALAALKGPSLAPLGPQERRVNPGEAVAFPVSIANPLDGEARIELEVSGPNAEWAALASRSIVVPAHATGQATVMVQVPRDAADGDRADLVLQAFSRDDPTARGLLRLLAEVDTDADQVDDSAMAPADGKTSPGPQGVFVVSGLLALVAAARRRR
ncbi:MAG: hypothetical protein ACYC2H_04355 [Thermoplasmatota archaeon]